MGALRRRRTIAAAAVLVLGSGAAAAAIASAGPASAASLDNPYVGANAYVNPIWSAEAANDGGSSIANNPTFIWIDRIAAITGTAGNNGTMGVQAYLDDALAKGKNLIQFVIYDLPNRDCAALASNGEIPTGGLSTYETQYIDPIATIMSNSKYANLRIVNVIEPDSLPNLVTNADQQNTATDACRAAKANGEYIQGVGYALAKLGAIPNVYNYIDAGHHGWLGWDTNFAPFGQIAHQAATANGATVNDVAGFITNTANYTVATEPYYKITDSVNGTSVRQSNWIDWNQYGDELSFSQALRNMLVSAGFNSNIGMLMDTGRNGWGGSARPTGPGPMTDVNAYIDGGRLDRRIHLGNWCNQTGAGIGERPTVNPASGVDAYVWVKPPGESDGDTRDGMCDPNYPGNARNKNNKTGALPNAPAAGLWFSAEFHMLLQNAYPPLSGSTGGPTPTSTTASPTPIRTTASPTPIRTTSSPTPIQTTGGNTGGPGGCSASYANASDWGSGFVGNVTVHATSSISRWTVTWSWGGNQQISNSWSATVTQSGKSVTATNASWNGSLSAGGSASFGFQGTYSGSNAVPTLSCTAS